MEPADAARIYGRVRRFPFSRRLVERDFVGKKESCAAVVELNQEHATVQIGYFTQHYWLFVEAA